LQIKLSSRNWQTSIPVTLVRTTNLMQRSKHRNSKRTWWCCSKVPLLRMLTALFCVKTSTTGHNHVQLKSAAGYSGNTCSAAICCGWHWFVDSTTSLGFFMHELILCCHHVGSVMSHPPFFCLLCSSQKQCHSSRAGTKLFNSFFLRLISKALTETQVTQILACHQVHVLNLSIIISALLHHNS